MAPGSAAISIPSHRLAALPGDDTLGDGPRGNRPAEPEAAQPASVHTGEPLTAFADRNHEYLDPSRCGVLFAEMAGMQCPFPAVARHLGGCMHEHNLDAPIPLCAQHEQLIGTLTVNCKPCSQPPSPHDCPVIFAAREAM